MNAKWREFSGSSAFNLSSFTPQFSRFLIISLSLQKVRSSLCDRSSTLTESSRPRATQTRACSILHQTSYFARCTPTCVSKCRSNAQAIATWRLIAYIKRFTTRLLDPSFSEHRKSRIHQCGTCTRERASIPSQLMGDLPAVRVSAPSRSFLHCGLAYAGPVHVRVSAGRGITSRKYRFVHLFGDTSCPVRARR